MEHNLDLDKESIMLKQGEIFDYIRSVSVEVYDEAMTEKEVLDNMDDNTVYFPVAVKSVIDGCYKLYFVIDYGIGGFYNLESSDIHKQMILKTHSGYPRTFKTLSAVESVVEELGLGWFSSMAEKVLH